MLMRRPAGKTATVILGQDAGDELPHLIFGDDALLTGLESPGGEMASDLRGGEHERRRVLGVAAVDVRCVAAAPVGRVVDPDGADRYVLRTLSSGCGAYGAEGRRPRDRAPEISLSIRSIVSAGSGPLDSAARHSRSSDRFLIPSTTVSTPGIDSA